MNSNGKTSARFTTPKTKEWGSKARKIEARGLKSSSKRAAIRESMES